MRACLETQHIGCTYVIVCDATLRAKVVYATDALRLIRLYIRDHHGSTTSRGSKVFTADTQYNEIWHPREIRSPVVVRSIGLLTYGVGQLSPPGCGVGTLCTESIASTA